MRQFTKMAIVETFIQLLNEKPLDKITVKEIVDNCGINRNTFYYHFEDIHGLLVYILNAEADKVIAEHASVESLEEGFIAAAKFALKNKRAAYHIYYSVSREVERLTEGVPEKYLANQEDTQLLIQFYKSGMVGLTTQWLSRGMKDNPEELIRRLGALLKGSLGASLVRETWQDFRQKGPDV